MKKRIAAIILAFCILLTLTACGKADDAVSSSDAKNTAWSAGHFSIEFPDTYTITYADPEAAEGAILSVCDETIEGSAPYFSVTKFKTADTGLTGIHDVNEDFAATICAASLSAMADSIGISEDSMTPVVERVTYHTYGQLEGARVDFHYEVHFTHEDVDYTNFMYCSYITIIDNYHTYAISFVSIGDTVDERFADVISSIECLD